LKGSGIAPPSGASEGTAPSLWTRVSPSSPHRRAFFRQARQDIFQAIKTTLFNSRKAKHDIFQGSQTGYTPGRPDKIDSCQAKQDLFLASEAEHSLTGPIPGKPDRNKFLASQAEQILVKPDRNKFLTGHIPGKPYRNKFLASQIETNSWQS
jgi:hypothetical protein